jgi:acid phosphatase family membrane protein YuiD
MTALRISSLRVFWENPVVLSAVSSWAFAQFVKALVALLGSRRRRIREAVIALFWKTGGMPSSHAALVASMTTATAFKNGIGSDIFALSLFMSLIVIRDALGVRRSSGQQARTLNHLGRAVAEKLPVEFHAVKEVHGHKPIEVVVGGLLGIFIAGAVCYL